MDRNKLTPQEIELKKVVASNLNELLNKTTKKKIDIHREYGIPNSSISDYFKGKSLPSEENVIKLAKFFNVNTYDIDPRMKVSDFTFNFVAGALWRGVEKDDKKYSRMLKEKFPTNNGEFVKFSYIVVPEF